MTEIVRSPSSELAIHGEFFSDNQIAVLRQLGVENANDADLAVFFHHVVRTGLDPFAKQIYMIERQGKQTIQTGIDGFRLIARRVADSTSETIALSDTEWCGKDGIWRDVWLDDEPPAAARITVFRNGDRFPAVALYKEYVARKKDGQAMKMWAEKPAGQLAKCAEALAWRKAFPQDLGGIYTHDEMESADTSPQREPKRAPERGDHAGRVKEAMSHTQQATVPGEVMASAEDGRHLVGLLNSLGYETWPTKQAAIGQKLGRDFTDPKTITADEMAVLLDYFQDPAAPAYGDAEPPADDPPADDVVDEAPAEGEQQ